MTLKAGVSVLLLLTLFPSTVGAQCMVVDTSKGTMVPCPPSLQIDYTAALKQLIDSQNQLVSATQALLAVEKDTNTQVTSMNKTFAQTLGAVGVFTAKYIAPAIVAYLAGKKVL